MARAESTVEVSEHVDAPAAAVYGLVSDLSKMGDWSPELERIEWKGGAPQGKVGARFVGHNGMDGKTWTTNGVVAVADGTKEFAFDVSAVGLKVARWGYRVTPDPDGAGCTLSEYWVDQRGWLVKKAGAMTTGVKDRESHNKAGMQETLRRIKAAAEAAAG